MTQEQVGVPVTPRKAIAPMYGWFFFYADEDRWEFCGFSTPPTHVMEGATIYRVEIPVPQIEVLKQCGQGVVVASQPVKHS